MTIGRTVISRGHDATDCALTTRFDRAPVVTFEVHTDEVVSIEDEIILHKAA